MATKHNLNFLFLHIALQASKSVSFCLMRNMKSLEVLVSTNLNLHNYNIILDQKVLFINPINPFNHFSEFESQSFGLLEVAQILVFYAINFLVDNYLRGFDVKFCIQIISTFNMHLSKQCWLMWGRWRRELWIEIDEDLWMPPLVCWQT